jgi:hypothetical protein
MKGVADTALCMDAHIGFWLAARSIFNMPTAAPRSSKLPRSWLLSGDEAAVLVEFDFEREAVNRLGMPEAHEHS